MNRFIHIYGLPRGPVGRRSRLPARRPPLTWPWHHETLPTRASDPGFVTSLTLSRATLDAKGCLPQVGAGKRSGALSKAATESRDDQLPGFGWNAFGYVLFISGF